MCIFIISYIAVVTVVYAHNMCRNPELEMLMELQWFKSDSDICLNKMIMQFLLGIRYLIATQFYLNALVITLGYLTWLSFHVIISTYTPTLCSVFWCNPLHFLCPLPSMLPLLPSYTHTYPLCLCIPRLAIATIL